MNDPFDPDEQRRAFRKWSARQMARRDREVAVLRELYLSMGLEQREAFKNACRYIAAAENVLYDSTGGVFGLSCLTFRPDIADCASEADNAPGVYREIAALDKKFHMQPDDALEAALAWDAGSEYVPRWHA